MKQLWSANSPKTLRELNWRFKNVFLNYLYKMKLRNRVESAKLLKLVKPDAQNSPVKTSKFTLLLKSWECSSNSNLTPVVRKAPRLTEKMDSQSDKTLENSTRQIYPGVSNAIGQENLETSQTLDLRQ